MAVEIVIPRLGWTMESGIFLRWLKQEGELVQPGEPLFELEGEKAIQEVEATDGGILRISPHAPQSGATVPVGAMLGCLAAAGEEINWASLGTTPAAASSQAAPVTAAERPPAAPSIRRMARELNIELSQVTPRDPAGRVSAGDLLSSVHSKSASTEGPTGAVSQISSPRARRVARELGIDWTLIGGSGRNGRVRERDVRASSASPVARKPMPRAAEPDLPGKLLPITPFRRTIAERMAAGVHVAAPVTLTATAEAGELVALRQRLKQEAGSDHVVPTYNDLLLKLTAAALVEFPLLNAQWRDAGIFVPDQVHIALAVQTDDGLLAPVIRDVSGLSLAELAVRSRGLVERAQQKRLTSEDLQGGTFTVTNLGSFGIEFFTPIINVPQCAILGVGQIRREPVVRDDEIVPADRLPLSLTFDHRIVDGAPAARFLQKLCRLIAEPTVALTCP
jgi:pyruvate dehydrogenase E2 component (dihydrolipoamide acetyltransferase)